MKRNRWANTAIFAFIALMVSVGLGLRWALGPDDRADPSTGHGPEVSLSPAPVGSEMTLADALTRRRSVRAFTDRRTTEDEIAQLCWAAQGVTDQATGSRTAPSAGALYPLVVLVVDPSGVREYIPERHTFKPIGPDDVRPQLQSAVLEQPPVGHAPMSLVIAMNPARTAAKYGRRAERFCLLEAGHVAQNVLLKATSLGLAGIPIAALDERRVARLLKLAPGLEPVYVLAIGTPAE